MTDADEDYGALSQEHLASIKRDMRVTLEDAAARAMHKVMTDRELLELAAKAAGIDYAHIDRHGAILYSEHPRNWNPLTDDGAAFRLAVKLRLDIGFEKLHTVSVWVDPLDKWITEYCNDGMGADISEKTRRAIVRAAAEIGRNMK